MQIIKERRTQDGRYRIGYEYPGAAGCWPFAPYFVELPSGMRHHYESLQGLLKGQYWPWQENLETLKLVVKDPPRCKRCGAFKQINPKTNRYRCTVDHTALLRY